MKKRELREERVRSRNKREKKPFKKETNSFI